MNKHTLKVNVLVCIVLDNICVEKGDIIGRKLDLPYAKNDNTRNSPEELRTILEIVSSRCYLDTPKDAAILRKNISDYLRNKKELYNELQQYLCTNIWYRNIEYRICYIEICTMYRAGFCQKVVWKVVGFYQKDNAFASLIMRIVREWEWGRKIPSTFCALILKKTPSKCPN